MSEIVLKDVCKAFGEKKVFESFNCSFSKGGRYCLMGASGRGKTTLLNLLLGLQKPDSGDIIGVPKASSAVFQEDRLCESFSAVGNIMAVTGKRVTKNDMIALLGELGLSGSEFAPVSELSGGMRRRVAIARALIAEGELVIFDEPFKGLDDATRDKIIKTVLAHTENKTLIVATHDFHDAELLNAEIINL